MGVRDSCFVWKEAHCAFAVVYRRPPANIPRSAEKVFFRPPGNKPVPRGVIIPMEAFVPTETSTFEQLMLPHLDSAYNLARWLLKDPHDAEDAVQDACVRAFRAFAGFRGG